MPNKWIPRKILKDKLQELSSLWEEKNNIPFYPAFKCICSINAI